MTDIEVENADVIEDTDVRVGFAVIDSGAYEGHFRAFFERREHAEAYLDFCQTSDTEERMNEPFIVPAAIDPETSTIVWANTHDDEIAIRALAERCDIPSCE